MQQGARPAVIEARRRIAFALLASLGKPWPWSTRPPIDADSITARSQTGNVSRGEATALAMVGTISLRLFEGFDAMHGVVADLKEKLASPPSSGFRPPALDSSTFGRALDRPYPLVLVEGLVAIKLHYAASKVAAAVGPIASQSLDDLTWRVGVPRFHALYTRLQLFALTGSFDIAQASEKPGFSLIALDPMFLYSRALRERTAMAVVQGDTSYFSTVASALKRPATREDVRDSSRRELALWLAGKCLNLSMISNDALYGYLVALGLYSSSADKYESAIRLLQRWRKDNDIPCAVNVVS